MAYVPKVIQKIFKKKQQSMKMDLQFTNGEIMVVSLTNLALDWIIDG
jgi:D-Tyr-tRNAtyr deacylase